MSLYTVSTGNTIAAADMDQVVNVLQEPSGNTEAGKYWLQGGCYQSGYDVGIWIVSLSRTSVPVSVSIDTADQSPTGSAGTPATQALRSSGFQIQFAGTTLSNTARCGGNWTIQF